MIIDFQHHYTPPQLVKGKKDAVSVGIDERGHVRAEPRTHTYAGIAVLEARMFAGLEPGRRPLKPVLDAAIARDELLEIGRAHV